jgi:hypothetical protein
MKNSTLLFLVCMAASSGASAQLYKTVSATGKVVYSDRPSEVRGSSVSVMGQQTAAPERSLAEAEGNRARRASGKASNGAATMGPTLHTAGRSGSTGKLERIDIQIDGSTGRTVTAAGPAPAITTGLHSN